MQSLKTKLSEHDTDVKSLNDKIETLQSSNRTNLSIIESHSKRDQTVADELKKQHERNVQLTRDLTAAQQAEQNAKGQLATSKYREESTQQQLELSRKNGEWLEAELKTKSEEALKYRKEKGSRIAELQRQNEDFRAAADAAKRAEQQLRDRLETMQSKVDEALVKLQKQEGQFASTVESYKHELDDQRRLVDMSDQLSKKHQQRVRDLDAEKERLRDNYEAELHRVRAEFEREHQASIESEEKIRQLESQVEELEARTETGPPPGSAPQTPRANGTMPRPSSPFGTPGSVRSKAGSITATQAIEQLHQVKLQLASERRRTNQLSEELDSMMSALEAKAPEIQELLSEVETLRTEIARMSELSQQSFEERDVAKRSARKAESALSNVQSENNILRTQLRDLGTQIQMLVFNIYAMEKGTEQLTEEEKFRLQQLEKGEITEEALSDMTETHQFITRKLVVFKDMKSLQAKNEELLRITRELAEQMESDEAIAAKHQAKDDHDKVEKLGQELMHMTDEARSIKNTMESYKTERDMFRRLLQQRGVGGDDSMMRMSLDGRLPLTSIESTEQTEALNEALRKVQAEFDGFREAQDSVRKDMRENAERLTSEKNSLQTDKIRLQGEVRLESERREMLQANYAALQSENAELQKRAQALSETAAKQDIRTQEVVEELVQAQGLLDSIRNENANLKAEKTLWKDIQDRQSKDNNSLIEEKNRLSNLLATQQTLENERNISDSEQRRQAQARITQLEQELSDAQRKLSAETEEAKNLQLRKDFEAKEAQKRIDDLMASLSSLREEHVGVKTARDHLQARVDELTMELRNAEERVGRLQPRPTPRPGTSETAQQQQLETEISQLNEEIADVKRELDIANTHLQSAKEQAEQYKELSTANEEALEDWRSSQEQYRQEMETLISEKDAKIQELAQRIEDVSTELTQSNTELSTLRDSQGEVARKYEDEKAILEEEVARLKEESARHLEAARFHQQDLRAQAEIASKAQQDYEHELVKHAEAAKLLQQVRTEHNTLRSEVSGLRAEAESAKVALAQGESSWEDRRQQLEQEIVELKARREDANAQNKLLHQQLESVSSQVTALQQNRSTAEDRDEVMSPVPMGDASEGLRELNNYLRREKEILEVQYDLKTQEAKRLQQQVEYTQSQLDEARLKLDQERTQSAESGKGSMTHQNLMEKLNELNLYRESSLTLRNQNGELKDQLRQKNEKIEELEGRVQPLEAEIDNLKTQKTFLEEEMKQVQEDRERWQKRTETILTKYGRVDPAEMEELKTKVTALESERDALKEGEQPLKDKIVELEGTVETNRTAWQATRQKIIDQAKEKARSLTAEKQKALDRVKELEELVNAANGERDGAQQSSQASTQQISELEAQVQTFRKQVEELQQQAASSQEQPVTAAPAAGDANVSSEIVKQLEQQLADIRKQLEAVNAQKLGAEQQLADVRQEMQTAITERDSQLEALRSSGENTAAAAPDAHQQDQTMAETNAETQQHEPLSDEERAALEAKIAAAEAQVAELTRKLTDLEENMNATLKKRSDQMKETLNKKLREERSVIQNDRETLKQDTERLSEDKLKFQQEKAIWQAENPSTGAAPKAPETQPPPPTPATPAKAEDGDAPPTPTTAGPSDLNNLDDASIRSFLATNQTAKNILTTNLKKRVDAELAKSKTEWEAKIASAKEQAQFMESKKSTLRINMAESKLRGANAKLGVVETAATETPQKAVVEVWEIAKKTPVPPAPAAANAAAKQTPAKPPGAAAAAQPTTPAAQSATPTKAAPNGTAGDTKAPAAAAIANPFAASTPAAATPQANASAPAAEGSSLPAKPQSQLPQPQQGQAGQRSSIPMPRGGAGTRGRGGTYVAPGQRAASGAQEGGDQAPATRGGRGGGRGGRGGRGGLNASASDFQPGNKRPRGDSEVSGGAKRARGGGGAPQ